MISVTHIYDSLITIYRHLVIKVPDDDGGCHRNVEVSCVKLRVVDESFEGNDGEQLSGSMSGGNGILIPEAMVTDQISR